MITPAVPVIKRSFAKKQEVPWPLAPGCSILIIIHFYKITDRRRIENARGKLIINLVRGYHHGSEPVFLFMKSGQPFCLLEEGRKTHQEIIGFQGLFQVLIGYFAN